MYRQRRIIPLCILAAMALVLSCGDDESPQGPGDDPTPSTLAADAGLNNSVSGWWTMCPDDDFSEYSLYRSTTSDISSDPPASPVKTASSASDTTFTDAGLEWGETYYYALRTLNTGGNSAWSNEVQVVMPDSGGCLYLSCYQVQGQQASSPYEGQEVTVTALVSSGGGELYGSYTVLADAGGGPWTGLVLFGDSAAAIARGDSILVTGTVSEYYGLTELTYLNSVEILSSGHTLPSPAALTTAQVNDEQYEGVVVSVSSAVVVSAGQYSYEINDGSGSCYLGNRGDYSEPSVGDTIDVQGPLFYEFDEWRIQPRDNNDISISGGGGGGDVHTCYEIQGQQASSPYEGQTVSVTGVVVVAGGEYYSSSAAYAVIMDAGGGPWAGLTLFGSDVSSLNRGDSVTVTGEIQEYYGFTELAYPTSVLVHTTGNPIPDPEPVTTADAGQEQWESVLLMLTNATVTEDDLGYGEWAVDDGSGDIRIDDLGDYSYTPVIGDTFSQIVGVLWYSFDVFKLEPRDDSDLILE
ncbi:MAG: hypothetical protein AVO35_06390 [Candidatus Aegiribacteria sp. MLS_C]|nr:MAG: hypothetical protein AVO35_06390 [Candidatus Aegiribacteria sp. MLS_C]